MTVSEVMGNGFNVKPAYYITAPFSQVRAVLAIADSRDEIAQKLRQLESKGLTSLKICCNDLAIAFDKVVQCRWGYDGDSLHVFGKTTDTLHIVPNGCSNFLRVNGGDAQSLVGVENDSLIDKGGHWIHEGPGKKKEGGITEREFMATLIY